VIPQTGLSKNQANASQARDKGRHSQPRPPSAPFAKGLIHPGLSSFAPVPTAEFSTGVGSGAHHPASRHPIAAALRRSSGSRLSRACHGEPVEGVAAPTQDRPAPQAGMVRGAKRIRSLYPPWMKGVTPPSFPPQPRSKARPRSPLSMRRLCAFAEQTSLPLLTYRGWKPLPQRFSSQSLQLRDEDSHHIRGRSMWFVPNAS
jgi:hypothetical protein